VWSVGILSNRSNRLTLCNIRPRHRGPAVRGLNYLRDGCLAPFGQFPPSVVSEEDNCESFDWGERLGPILGDEASRWRSNLLVLRGITAMMGTKAGLNN
jgi:hypothetical protein